MVNTFGRINDATVPRAGRGARILVVDDEQYMCDICTRALRSSGYEIVATTDAAAAAEQLRRGGTFDLLLVDIKMPRIGGLELAQYAREADPAIAIIIMTGHASIENLQQAVRRGIADFLSKPFELEELRLAVDQALHKRTLLQDSLRLREIERLLQSSRAINATLDRPQLARIVLRTALELAPGRAGFLHLTEDGTSSGELIGSEAGWELSPLASACIQQSLVEGQPIGIRERGVLCNNGSHALHYGLAVPLAAHERQIGVLLICDERPELLRPGIQEMVGLLANQAGIALHNALLFGHLEDAYQRLQELDRLKSEFIAIASHELRTPLSIVLGYAAMVFNQSHGEHRDYAQRVLNSAERIKEIVDDMVNLRHLEAHETRLELETASVQRLIEQVVERMQPIISEKEHTLTTALPDPAIISQIDREKFLMALGNLVSNAVKFTPRQGQIGIELEQISAAQVLQMVRQRPAPAGGAWNPELETFPYWLVIRVRDNGIGIAPREQARIFERFYQVADSLTREQGGTGLGLAIARELVALHGGTIWVESIAGNGSTFIVAIPLRPA